MDRVDGKRVRGDALARGTNNVFASNRTAGLIVVAKAACRPPPPLLNPAIGMCGCICERRAFWMRGDMRAVYYYALRWAGCYDDIS